MNGCGKPNERLLPVLADLSEYWSGTEMRLRQKLIVAVFPVLAVSLAALHAPGQMSVDSVSALYEGATGQAVGWGPTFFSSFLAWLGNDVIGTSLFVAINCYVTYGCVSALLASMPEQPVSLWRHCLAWLLALNPLFMFYVGIVWKDVMLTTASMAAVTCILLGFRRKDWLRYVLLIVAAILISSLSLIRQQGILIAAPLGLTVAGLFASVVPGRSWRRLAVFSACLVFMMGASELFSIVSSRTVRPQPHSPISVGMLTIEAYDIAGMIKYAKPNDTDTWANAPEAAKAAIRGNYSAQRIDTIWHVAAVRDYFNTLSARQFVTIWLAGVKHHPRAYFEHRFQAFSYLFGLRSIDGCVPAYWGVAGVPEQMKALGFQEAMDSRARIIGKRAMQLYGTPVFRNWAYGLILLLASIAVVARMSGRQRWVCGAIAVSAWLYLGSFLPTTIACDVRYLYPVAGLSTLLAIYALMQNRVTLAPRYETR